MSCQRIGEQGACSRRQRRKVRTSYPDGSRHPTPLFQIPQCLPSKHVRLPYLVTSPIGPSVSFDAERYEVRVEALGKRRLAVRKYDGGVCEIPVELLRGDLVMDDRRMRVKAGPIGRRREEGEGEGEDAGDGWDDHGFLSGSDVFVSCKQMVP